LAKHYHDEIPWRPASWSGLASWCG
jgi:hypothetical protein